MVTPQRERSGIGRGTPQSANQLTDWRRKRRRRRKEITYKRIGIHLFQKGTFSLTNPMKCLLTLWNHSTILVMGGFALTLHSKKTPVPSTTTLSCSMEVNSRVTFGGSIKCNYDIEIFLTKKIISPWKVGIGLTLRTPPSRTASDMQSPQSRCPLVATGPTWGLCI